MKKLLAFLLPAVLMLLLSAGCTEDYYNVEFPENEGKMLLISHLKQPLLTVMDYEQKEIISEVDMPFTISHMVKVSPAEIVMASQEEEALYLFDMDERKASPLTETAQGVNELLFVEESGMLYAANPVKNEIIALNINEPGEVLRSDTGDHPASLTYTGDELYIANVYGNSIQKFDSSTLELLDTFHIVDRPEGLLYKDGYLIAGGHGSSGELNDQIFLYSLESGQTINKAETGLMPVDFTMHDDNTIFAVSHGSHEVHEIDLNNFKVMNSLEIGYNPYAASYSDGQLFVSSLDGDVITIINTGDFTVSESVSVAAGPHTIIVLEENTQ